MEKEIILKNIEYSRNQIVYAMTSLKVALANLDHWVATLEEEETENDTTRQDREED